MIALLYMIYYIIWLLTIILYAPIFYHLYCTRWDAVDYTHAYFILPVSLWLVWRTRKTLRDILEKPVTTNPFSIPLLILGLFLYIFGWKQDYLFISTLSLVPLLYGLTGSLYGTKTTKILSFPILYLLLLIPPPLGILDNITLPMRHGISVATETTLKLFHYPITREGLLLSIKGSEIFMGQPCSGFRSLITMFSLALVYIYITKGNLTKKSILLCSIVPLALFGNLIRVIATCLTSYYFGEAVGQGFFHSFSGAVIFVIMILGLIGLEMLLDKRLKGHEANEIY